MFGRVPFAFYVAHFLIHTLSVILGKLQGLSFRQMMTVFLFYPKGYGVGLPDVYLAWMRCMENSNGRWVLSARAANEQPGAQHSPANSTATSQGA